MVQINKEISKRLPYKSLCRDYKTVVNNLEHIYAIAINQLKIMFYYFIAG